MKSSNPRIFGVLGANISHTLSPQIFSILFGKYRLPHGYFVFDIRRGELERFVESARLLGFGGFNVTVPFKCDIMSYLDKLDPSADCCRAVNLVLQRGGRLVGYNTDIAGIEAVFKEEGTSFLSGKRVLLVGAGGVARAALAYVLTCSPGTVSIVNRSRKRLETMLADLGIESDSDRIEAYQLTRLRRRLEGLSWDVIVNGTPVATESVVPVESLGDGTVIYEAAYNLQDRTIRSGTKIIGGVDMLIYQALKGFEVFTGVDIGNHRRTKAAIRRRLAV